MATICELYRTVSQKKTLDILVIKKFIWISLNDIVEYICNKFRQCFGFFHAACWLQRWTLHLKFNDIIRSLCWEIFWNWIWKGTITTLRGVCSGLLAASEMFSNRFWPGNFFVAFLEIIQKINNLYIFTIHSPPDIFCSIYAHDPVIRSK